MALTAKEFHEVCHSLAVCTQPSDAANHRRARRMHYPGKATLLPMQDGQCQAPIEVQIVDLSCRGMRFLYHQALGRGTSFVLQLAADEGQGIHILCLVTRSQLWRGKDYSIGTEFVCTQTPPASKDEEKMQLEMAALRDKLFAA